MENKLTHRYIARIRLQAETPLFVGSGDTSLLTDALVQKDFNGLPMIPGTAIAGVVRHAMEDHLKDEKSKEELADIFGYQEEKKDSQVYRNRKKEGKGSRLFFSHAYMVVENHKVSEGFDTEINPELKNKLDKLPKRQHVRITDKGVAKDKGLFDNEVVYKGVRFVCEIELKGTEKDEVFWKELLSFLQSPLFRIGQGTRNGYGNLSAKLFKNENENENKSFDLKQEKDFDAYLTINPSLNSIKHEFDKSKEQAYEGLTHYRLSLKPESTFIFSSANPDKDVDNTPTVEEVMEYQEDGKIMFKTKTLIPGSSIKGTLSHRLAYRYNKLNHYYVGNTEAKTETENKAVLELLGSEADDTDERKTAQRGRVLIDDIYIDADNSKVFNHVAIDRFTGGAIDGALFSEKVSMLKADETITLNVYVENKAFINEKENEKSLKEDLEKALKETLQDICKGLLPLGGMTTKGHGFFTGTLKKNNQTIYPEKQ